MGSAMAEPVGRRFSFMLIFLLAGCTLPGLRPVDPAPGDPPDLARAEVGPLSLMAATGRWSSADRFLERYFIPLEVGLTNSGAEAVAVRFRDVVLVDEANRQIPALSPRDVVSLLFGPGSEVAPEEEAPEDASSFRTGPAPKERWIPPFRLSIRISPYDPFWDPWWPYPYEYWDYGPSPETAREILHRGLAEGEVRPGLMVSGVLFFKEDLEEGDEGKGYRMVWQVPSASSGEILAVLELPFAVSPN